jgi:hypothetical protein
VLPFAGWAGESKITDMRSQIFILLAAIALASFASSAHATLLYTLNFDPLNEFCAASISYTTEDFAFDYGDTLYYHSGDVNGCAPTEIWVEPFRNLRGFSQIPFIDTTKCGDGIGPGVDGFFFRVDDFPNPLTTGTFVSTNTAGRVFAGLTPSGAEGLVSWEYAGGTLIISEISSPIATPATAALFGIALSALGFIWKRKLV